MSTEYADQKVRQILAKAGGQGKVSEQAIRALIERDPQFLQSLVSPYLAGIIGHAIDRARKQLGLKETATAVNDKQKPLLKKTVRATSKPVPAKGMNALLGALAQQFEKEGSPEPRKSSGKVSQNHIDALKMLAGKSTVKKKP